MRISDWSSDVCSSDLVASFSIGFTLILPIFPSGRARRQAALLEIPVQADSETPDRESRQVRRRGRIAARIDATIPMQHKGRGAGSFGRRHLALGWSIVLVAVRSGGSPTEDGSDTALPE